MNFGFCSSVLMIIRNCSLIRGSYSDCRIRTIMSNHTPLTCGVLGSKQCGLAGVPDDHKQSVRDTTARDWIKVGRTGTSEGLAARPSTVRSSRGPERNSHHPCPTYRASKEQQPR
jgi:hypothetical protein